jgi:hypothetical protein
VSTATRRPPFARDIEAAVAAGRHPNVFVFATADAWDRARRHRERHGADSALLLPPGEAPDAYRWPIVSGGVFVVAVGRPRTLAFEVARSIVSAGTPLATAVYGNDEMLVVREAGWRLDA